MFEMGDHGPRIDHIIIGAKDVEKAAAHIFQVGSGTKVTCMLLKSQDDDRQLLHIEQLLIFLTICLFAQ